MIFRLQFTEESEQDLAELHAFLASANPSAAAKALTKIRRAFGLLEDFPYACRKALDPPEPGLRELVISFGRRGYVALFRIEGDMVSILSVRQQRESDYH
ncbi:MAG: type II toxin-antitoxin system RelE/ParE family toxin [Archangium sp.]|nr:type II toxin-antitoxin system RelE/ParE family toxin [Archangium sp.]